MPGDLVLGNWLCGYTSSSLRMKEASAYDVAFARTRSPLFGRVYVVCLKTTAKAGSMALLLGLLRLTHDCRGR